MIKRELVFDPVLKLCDSRDRHTCAGKDTPETFVKSIRLILLHKTLLNTALQIKRHGVRCLGISVEACISPLTIIYSVSSAEHPAGQRTQDETHMVPAYVE